MLQILSETVSNYEALQAHVSTFWSPLQGRIFVTKVIELYLKNFSNSWRECSLKAYFHTNRLGLYVGTDQIYGCLYKCWLETGIVKTSR
jgi:hypothetical protein